MSTPEPDPIDHAAEAVARFVEAFARLAGSDVDEVQELADISAAVAETARTQKTTRAVIHLGETPGRAT